VRGVGFRLAVVGICDKDKSKKMTILAIWKYWQ